MSRLLRMPLSAHEVGAEKESVELRTLKARDRIVGAGGDWTLAIERRVDDAGDIGRSIEGLDHSPNGRLVPGLERLESRGAVDVKGPGDRCSQTRFNDGREAHVRRGGRMTQERTRVLREHCRREGTERLPQLHPVQPLVE